MELINLIVKLFFWSFISILVVSPVSDNFEVLHLKSYAYSDFLMLSHKIKLAANELVELSNDDNKFFESGEFHSDEEIFLGYEHSDSFATKKFNI